MQASSAFLIGINYWPIKKAMYWWQEFSRDEIRQDFKQLVRDGFQCLRFFLLWEDFQPHPDRIDRKNLDNLKWLADLAETEKLSLMPTFFCGHMSGVNWLPYWMLIDTPGQKRFPVYSQGVLKPAAARNFYVESYLKEAQLYQIETICSSLRDHPAIAAYDLGNESSNLVIPPDRDDGCEWLDLMSQAIKKYSGGCAVTLGMHAEDLEEDRNLGPQDAAPYVDFLSMHGYPFYLDWVENPLDPDLLPFLAELTCKLGQKPVLFQEMGAPTLPFKPSDNPARLAPWDEMEVQAYYKEVIPRLEKCGVIGIMAWCYADYDPSLWQKAPLRQNHHERYFGLYRCDGQPKAAVSFIKSYQAGMFKQNSLSFWDDKETDLFYRSPRRYLTRWFEEYKKMHAGM